ncbi:Nephrocystin-3, partial [Lachnellula arida]
INAYVTLAKEVFSKKRTFGNFGKDGSFEASKLENAIKGVLKKKLGEGREEEMMLEAGEGCKTQHLDADTPVLFRTWKAAKNPGDNCTIWEACRATSAAPRVFESIFIGQPGLQAEYIDGGMGCNNPTQVLIEQAAIEFGPSRNISCVVSIGTGLPKVIAFNTTSFRQQAVPSQLIDAMKDFATSSERVARQMKKDYENLDLIHRLNVEDGLQDISLEEWEKMGEVKTHTDHYLGGHDVDKSIDIIVAALVDEAKNMYPLSVLDRAVPLPLARRLGLQSIPPRLVSRFVERKQPLEDMKKHLRPPVGSSVPAVCVLQWMGGCGKSQLALKYCHLTRDNDPASHVLWVDATSITSARQSIATIVQIMSPGISAADDEANLKIFKETLSTSGASQQNWLLVFDNYDDPEKFERRSIRESFPQASHGSIIITTRSTDMKRLGHVLSVSDMTRAEALKLLFQISEAEESDANSKEALKIVERLGLHALAIDQAGAYIRSRNLELGLYLDRYNRRRKKVLQELPEEWEYRTKSEDDPNKETDLSVFTTWELSFSQISGNEEERKDKERILTLGGFMNNNDIKELFFKEYASENDSWLSSCRQEGEFDVLEFQDVLKELHKLSLLQSFQVNSTGSSFSLHPLIQDWVKLRVGLKAQKEYTIEATAMLCSYLESIWNETVGFFTGSFEESQILVDHVATTISNRKDFHIDQLCFLVYDEVLRSFLFGNGAPSKPELSKELALLNLSHKETLWGEKHPHTINAMNELAACYSMFDEWDEAESLHKKAFSLSQGLLGVESHEIFSYLSDLANCLLLQGKNDEAERLLQPQIPAAEETLGRRHEYVLSLKTTLANSLRNQGQYDKAEVLCRDVLAAQRETVGDAHGDTLITSKSLSLLLLLQGKLEEAETLYRQCLTLSTELLGEDDPRTFRIMYDLGSVIVRKNSDISEAEKLLKQAFHGQDSALGSSHPETLMSLYGLGDALEKKGDLKAAEKAFGLLIERHESAAEPDHSVILEHMFRRGRLLKNMGDLSAAEEIFRRLISRQESALGPDHCDTLKSLYALGSTLCEKEDINAAMKTMRLYVQRHDSKDPIAGRNDPERLQALFVLGTIFQHKGGSGEAEEIFSSLISLVQDGTGNEAAMKDNPLGRRQEGTQDS